MDWEQRDGVRWLGWTLIFAALPTLALSLLAHDMPGWLSSLAVLSALSTFVFPLLIGVLFPEDNWRWGPCLGMVVALIVLLAIPETGQAEQTGIGLVTRKDQFLFILIWGGWWFFPVLSLLYVGLAAVGIRIGENRLEKQRWDSDEDFRNMFATDRSAGSGEREHGSP